MVESAQPRSGGMRSLERGLQILAYVQSQGQTTAADIVDSLDVPQSTTYRYIATLVRSGFLVEFDGQLIASQRLADLSRDRDAEIKKRAAPELASLASRTNQTSCLTVRMHLASLCLSVHRVNYSVTSHREGRALALYAGASATPLLAHAPEDVRERVLAGRISSYTARTPDRASIRREIATIRQNGHHLTRGWITHGMTGVGVPVLVGGSCIAALSIIAPDCQVPDHPAELIYALHEAADGLAERVAQGRRSAAAH